MKLAISNIAWKPEARAAIYGLLQELGVAGLEIAPGQAFAGEDDPIAPGSSAIRSFLAEIQDYGLTLVSMQSLLYGVEGASLFGTSDERSRFVTGVSRAIRLAGQLRIPNLVLGSPTARVIPEGMDPGAVETISTDVFRALGEECLAAGTKLALEANPPAYRTNFMNTTAEAVAVAEMVAHPAVAVNLDLGAAKLTGENARAGAWLTGQHSALISHVHISEPNLAPVPADDQLVASIARDAAAGAYSGWFSIEMRCVGDDNTESVRHAIMACQRAMGGFSDGAA